MRIEIISEAPSSPVHNAIIVDTESNDRGIVVFGYFELGKTSVHQIVFDPPVSNLPRDIQEILETYAGRIYCYYVEHEAEILNIPNEWLNELMPYPYQAKEKLISILSLDRTSSKYLPKFSKSSLGRWVFHNYSCLMKQLVLYLGQDTFLRHNIKEIMIERINDVMEATK